MATTSALSGFANSQCLLGSRIGLWSLNYLATTFDFSHARRTHLGLVPWPPLAMDSGRQCLPLPFLRKHNFVVAMVVVDEALVSILGQGGAQVPSPSS